jgi:hypothetical protein
MRRLFPLALAASLVVLVLASHAATPAKKKSTTKTGAKAVATKNSKGGATRDAKAAPKRTATKASPRRGKRGPVRSVPVRTRQLSPTPDRYKEIQKALAAKGYLPAEQANGQWTDASADALKRFQTDQNIDATGKINSLSLIALGLGPKHDAAAPAKEPPAPQ